MPTREEHESGLAMFLVPARRGRFREALGSEKSRRKLRGRLAHLRDLDERFVEVVPRDADAATVFGLLTSAGAPETCSVLSEDPDLRRRGDGSGGVLGGLSPRRAWSAGARSGDDGRAVALLLRARRAIVAADRASLRGGRRDARDLRQPGARSHDGRALRQRHEAALASCSARCWRCAPRPVLSRSG
jgi:hypothetical protein